MSVMHEAWMLSKERDEKRIIPDRPMFSLTDEQVDAVDDTAGLQPVNRAGKERANEHAWNNQF